MYKELKTLHDLWITTRKPADKGRIVDLLKRINYFNFQASLYGAEILLYYLPIIDPYILRKDMNLVKSDDSFVIISGIIYIDLHEKSGQNGEEMLVFSDGMIFNCSDTNYKRIYAMQDTEMIRINFNASQNKKHVVRLRKIEKQRGTKSRQISKILFIKKQLNQLIPKIKNREFFKALGTYDLNELISQCKLITKPKNSRTHSYSENVNNLYYIISGVLKVQHSVNHYPKQDNVILSKFMIHKKRKDSSIKSYMEREQCLGLQQYFWNQNYHSNGEVISHEAILLSIPIQSFEKKFNQLINYSIVTNMRGLIETKKALFQKTMNSKKAKDQQIKFETEKIATLRKYKTNLQMHSITKSQRNGKISHGNITGQFPKECYMPQRLIHKLKVYKQKYSSLPKIQEHQPLFPEEYQKATIPLDLKQKLQMAEAFNDLKKGNQNLEISPKNKNHKVQNLRPEDIRQRFLFENLQLQNKIQGSTSKSSKKKDTNHNKSCEITDSPEKGGKNPQKISIRHRRGSIGLGTQKYNTLQNLYEFSSTKYHHNKSIYNNFKALNNKGIRLIQNLHKTLEIK